MVSENKFMFRSDHCYRQYSFEEFKNTGGQGIGARLGSINSVVTLRFSQRWICE